LDPAVKAQRQLESIEKQIADLETRASADKDAQLQLKHLHHQIGFLRQQIRDRVNAWQKTMVTIRPLSAAWPAFMATK
jgi:uncharacterized protein involved in exopolysaccharide biosynthesis